MDSVWIVISGFLPAALRSATPLLFALLGETLSQRGGIVNLGSEGQMLVGAAAAFGVTAATGQPWLGLACGAGAGMLLSIAHAILCLRFGANQFASGISVWMIGFGLSGYLGSSLVGQSIEGFEPARDSAFARALPSVADLSPTVWLAGLSCLLCAGFLYRTRLGLELRAAGESASAARAAGIAVTRVQTLGVLLGGGLSGLGGAALSIDFAQTWAEGMTQGRGLVAVGLVIVARWNPLLALPSALLFGAAEALSLRVQSVGAGVSAQLLHTLPYLVSLAVFVASCLRAEADGGAPAGLRALLER